MEWHRVLRLGAILPILWTTVALGGDKSVTIGVINDQSGPYSDMGGVGSVAAAQLAIKDSGLEQKGWTIKLISADHQNKADVASNIVRQWFDTEGVDVVADVT